MPINITLIYRAISSGSQLMRPTVYIEVWRNRTLWEPGINPCNPLYVANGDSEDNIYSILNLRFDLCGVSGYGNDVCMVFYNTLSLRERVRVRGNMLINSHCCPPSGLRPPYPSWRRNEWKVP
jgi:hypothetical protein